jgi:hypothetical protein
MRRGSGFAYELKGTLTWHLLALHEGSDVSDAADDPRLGNRYKHECNRYIALPRTSCPGASFSLPSSALNVHQPR